jgi:hypothetical protein
MGDTKTSLGGTQSFFRSSCYDVTSTEIKTPQKLGVLRPNSKDICKFMGGVDDQPSRGISGGSKRPFGGKITKLHA